MGVRFTEMGVTRCNYGRPLFSLVLVMLTATHLAPPAIGQQGTYGVAIT